MAKGHGPWREGRRAWERVHEWYQGSRSGRADAGESAVEALADVGAVRRLLDEVELVAVRTARRHGKSWAEIATKLGVTRQSAWERWRDLDDEGGSAPAETGPAVSGPAGSVAAVTEAAARELAARRRRSTVRVPNVVGMSWDDAREALLDAGLVAASPDPDGPPLAAAGWPNAVVTDQSPESGAKVPAGSPVRLWLERGGGSAGVREPRRPRPPAGGGRMMRDEITGEAVG